MRRTTFSGGLPYPENQVRVLSMPAVSSVMREETPRELVVLVLHQNAHAPRFTRLILHILLPDDRQEQRTRRVHHRNVR